MADDSYTVTTVGDAPTVDRAHRMRMYTITMSIRMLCVGAIVFVDGWWILLCVIGGVFLPYVAVVVANVRANPDSEPDLEAVQFELAPGANADTTPDSSGPSFIIPVDEAVIRVKSVEKY